MTKSYYGYDPESYDQMIREDEIERSVFGGTFAEQLAEAREEEARKPKRPTPQIVGSLCTGSWDEDREAMTPCSMEATFPYRGSWYCGEHYDVRRARQQTTAILR